MIVLCLIFFSGFAKKVQLEVSVCDHVRERVSELPIDYKLQLVTSWVSCDTCTRLSECQ